MTNYSAAYMINELGDDDFYEVMMEIARMNNIETVDEFTTWLNEVLHECENKMEGN